LLPSTGSPVVASIYQLDSLVRRATSLQLTADAKGAAHTQSGEEVAA
jgi:NADH-quinone oxidoreductase subunit G